MTTDITQALCNNCRRETEHKIIHTEEYPAGKNETVSKGRKKDVLSCRGCKEISIRELFPEITPRINKKKFPRKIAYSPPRLWRQPPNWLADINRFDPDLKDLMDEVYSATNNQGFPTLIDLLAESPELR